MKVLILEDVIEHQVRLERIFQYHTRQREKSVNLKNTLKMMK